MSSLTTHPGHELRTRRVALGLTQRDVARLADCSLTTVRDIEGGAIPKKSAVLTAMVDVLDRREAAARVTA